MKIKEGDKPEYTLATLNSIGQREEAYLFLNKEEDSGIAGTLVDRAGAHLLTGAIDSIGIALRTGKPNPENKITEERHYDGRVSSKGYQGKYRVNGHENGTFSLHRYKPSQVREANLRKFLRDSNSIS